MNGLNWNWIAIGATVPLLVAAAIAFPFWRKGHPIMGNLAGTVVVFTSAFALILRERIQLDRIEQACIDQGSFCWSQPSAFTRFALYSFVALFEIMILFYLSVREEERQRRRGYAPEWRR